MKLKMEKAKHDHKITNLLKVALFTLLMFLPFINVAVRCAYVTLNKNAYQSYSGSTQQIVLEDEFNTNQVYNADDLIIGNIYKYNIGEDIQDGELLIDYSIIYFVDNNEIKMMSSESSYIGLNNGYYEIEISLNSDMFLYVVEQIANFDIYFVLLDIEINTIGNQSLTQLIDESNFLPQTTRTINVSTLDNVFEYSINQLEQNPLYNWALNTGIYTGIATMTTQLGITTTIIPMILTYWLMLTVIYIIIDIVIQLFVYLTHIFSKD